jgi:hypothetical protein
MIDVETYRQNAADCVRQAESETAPEDKNILLNVALAWVRLAHQVQQVATQNESAAGPEAPEAVDTVESQTDTAEVIDLEVALEKPPVTH